MVASGRPAEPRLARSVGAQNESRSERLAVARSGSGAAKIDAKMVGRPVMCRRQDWALTESVTVR
jgi:hypothetical protein